MVTEVEDCVSGKIFSVLLLNISTTNVCSRDEDSLRQATDKWLLPQVCEQSLI